MAWGGVDRTLSVRRWTTEELVMTRHGLSLLLLVAVAALVVCGCGRSKDEGGEEQGIPVKTAPVVFEEVSVPVHTSGKLTSVSEARLSFKVGGIVGEIPVDEGESVKKGRLLAALKADEIDARVNQARSAFENARRDLERARRLYADSVITLEQVQDAETGFDMARSQFEIAEFNQAYSSIYAPTDGRILKRFVESNELVGQGTPVFLFGSTGNQWTVRAGISDRDIIRLELGDSASASFDAYPGRHFPARVVEIGEAADPMSGAYEVELELSPGKTKLVSGFVARVDIYPAKCEPMYVVPIEALMEADGGRGYIYLPDESGRTAKKTAVTLGCLIGERVAIASGLEGADRVVTDGAAYLTDKASIRIVNDPADLK
jgi:RND family efflux transporter MFP subunit